MTPLQKLMNQAKPERTFTPGDDGVCRACGLSDQDHIFRCGECQRELRMGTCGCGAVHMPDEKCPDHPNAEPWAWFHCPPEHA